MTKTMNNKLIVVSLVSALALLSYVLYYNVDIIGQTVEGFFVESGCDADNQIFADLTEEDTDETDDTDDTDVVEDRNVADILEHGHDKLVRKTGVYPLLRTLGDKLDKKCPKLPNMSKYVLKSKIKPDKKCPDLSNYILKTNILPEKKCPDCICPKVSVSAGLCKKCEPCAECPPPKRCPRPSCPKPRPCPEVRCPKIRPCPPQDKCPSPRPCKSCRKPKCNGCPSQDKCPSPRPCKSCRKPKCNGCPNCEEKSDGLLHHPKYPGSKDFESLRANNGRCDGEPDPSILNKFKNLF